MQQKLAHQAKMQATVTQLNRQRDATLAEAKSQLGLWSDAGIEESRTAFWYCLVNICDTLEPKTSCPLPMVDVPRHAPGLCEINKQFDRLHAVLCCSTDFMTVQLLHTDRHGPLPAMLLCNCLQVYLFMHVLQ